MPEVVFLPSRLSAEVPPGTELLEAARRAGVEVDADCGGQGTCGACALRLVAGQVDTGASLPPADLDAGCVRACTARVLDGGVTVEVPERAGRQAVRLARDDAGWWLRDEQLPQVPELDPAAVRWPLQVPPPALQDGLSDLDRIEGALREPWGPEPVVFALPAMRAAAEALRAEGGRVTATAIREPARLRVIGVEAGHRGAGLLGIAVDLGTTTAAVQLIDLSTGRVLATGSDYNAQIPCGLDVISRIDFARRPGGLEELRHRAVDTVNRLVREVAASEGVDVSEIRSATISGNTTMTHLLLGLAPEHIRLEPYSPTALEIPPLRAAELGLEIDPDGAVFLSPCVGSYLGGDVTAGLLCTDLVTETEDVNLFIDIGTNGELVVGNAEFLMACACSAGPAFEGGGIDCGMRAATGAIHRLQVDPESGRARYSTIDDTPPRGLCGSGLIDLLANLLLTGWIDLAGRLDRSRRSPFVEIEGRRARYVIAPADETDTGRPIAITETGIENVIRAKAAIYSASSLLLKRVGLSFSDLAKIYVAGAFGSFLDLEQATVIGLIPDLPPQRFHYLGNASLTGSRLVAVSRDFRRRQRDLARRITNVELSAEPDYMDHYTGALFLPHTDLGRFPSVAKALAGSR